MPGKHTTVRDGKRLLWYTEGLWRRAESLTPFDIEIDAIRELDENCWFGPASPTLREVLSHLERIQKADLNYPIILNDDGSLMDGGHRLCKAILEGRTKISAVKFPVMPEPDEVGHV